MAATGIAAASLSISAVPSHAQDIGKAIADSITGGANTGSPTAQAVPPVGSAPAQSAVDRGVNRAMQGALQGQSPRDAIRTGLGEAAQSAVETPMQTQNRDQLQQFQQLQNQQLQQGVPGSQPMQLDSQGRAYYRDASGQPVYASQNGQVTAQQNQYYGAQFQPNDRGVGIQSVRQDGFAGRAGLNQGDVILSVNGRQVRDPNGLVQTMDQIGPNESVRMIVVRNGQEQIITTTTSETYGQNRQSKSSSANDSVNARLDEMRKQIQKLQKEVESLQSKVEHLDGK
ncbi:C-terminal processing protease CtpA/Prc [Rhodopirellula rubra]|uniref:C-terminal processing protease CtpA/Prc n=2 Tax=Aporhodopirellula rubra TaxID=980271 RepID=A0A7W5H8N2_9BACT|nr:C-terminal processing protease CtpA/Prc [Aporhodopirellula rubra]